LWGAFEVEKMVAEKVCNLVDMMAVAKASQLVLKLDKQMVVR
jgi:hypothetical protein